MRGGTDTGSIDLSVEPGGDPRADPRVAPGADPPVDSDLPIHRGLPVTTDLLPSGSPGRPIPGHPAATHRAQGGADDEFAVQLVDGLLLQARFGTDRGVVQRLDELLPLLMHSTDPDLVLLSLYARGLALQRVGASAAIEAGDLVERASLERRRPTWTATAWALRARARLDAGDPAQALADLSRVDLDLAAHDVTGRAWYYLLDTLAGAFSGLRLYDSLEDARSRLEATLEQRTPLERALHWMGWAMELACAALEPLARGAGEPDQSLLRRAATLADRALEASDRIDALGGARVPTPLRHRAEVVLALTAVHRGDPVLALRSLERYLLATGEPGDGDQAPLPASTVDQLAVLAAVRAHLLVGSTALARHLDDDACLRPVPVSGELLELCRARERVWLETRVGGDPVPALRRLTDLLARVGWSGLDLAAHTSRQILEQQSLRAESRTDALTGVGNRRALDEELRTMLRAAPLPMALILVDLDDFKAVNDQFTHVVGDEVLRRVAASLARDLRSADRLVRYGGDEFVVLLPQTGDQDARMVAARMAAAIAELPWGELADGLQVRVTTGCAALWSLTERRPDRDAERLFRRADEALLDAKRRRGIPHATREWSPSPAESAPTVIVMPDAGNGVQTLRSGRRAAVIDLTQNGVRPYPTR